MSRNGAMPRVQPGLGRAGPRSRSRAALLVALAAAIALGLASRRFRPGLPAFVGAYAGDTLWATAVFVTAGLLWPRARTAPLAAGSALFALAIELSQLAHPGWLQAVRHWPLAGYLIGYDFAWSDLACYAAGIGLGVAVDRVTGCGGPAPGRSRE
jgi:hypothetical protein